MFPTSQQYPILLDLSAKPLEDGYVYFGLINLNPITNPQTVYWDAAGLQPAAQPLRTQGGYVVRNGKIASVYIAGDYSTLVQDKKRRLIFSSPTSTNLLATLATLPDGASFIGFLQQGAGAILRTVQAKLYENVSLADFGSTSAALNAALLAHRAVEITEDIALDANIFPPDGSYIYSRVGAVITTSVYGFVCTNKSKIAFQGLNLNMTGAGVGTTFGGSGVNNIAVRSCNFEGGQQYGIAFNGNRVKVRDCDFTGTCSQSFLAFLSCFDYMASGNSFHDVGLGNNVITRSSRRGMILGNSFNTTPNNPVFIDTLTQDTVVANNTLVDCGDSGILLGDDLVGGVPVGITIIGNNVDNCPNTGIGTSVAALNIAVIGNTIRNCGNGGSTQYDSGILAYGAGWTITGNTLIDDQGPPTMTFGIYLQPPSIPPVGQKTLYNVANNNYKGVTNKIGIPFASGVLCAGIDINEGSVVDYPQAINFDAWTGALPTAVATLTSWSLQGAGITNAAEAVIVISGSSAKVVSTVAVGGLLLDLLALNAMQGSCILEVTGFVRGDGAADSGVVHLYTTAGGSAQETSIAFSGVTWTPVTLRMAIGVTTVARVAFYSDIGKTVYFDEFQVRVVAYNN